MLRHRLLQVVITGFLLSIAVVSAVMPEKVAEVMFDSPVEGERNVAQPKKPVGLCSTLIHNILL
jgi:hypothetical protein